MIISWFDVFLHSYSYAASKGHLEPWLQYVSDSGTYTPSAGYFAESLDIIAILSEYK